MKLYRPVGIRELELIKLSGMTEFPQRLPEQPIFYPVLNITYARQIAKEWNTKSAPGYSGFVTEFDVDDKFISKYEEQVVGNSVHKELWIPSEELEAFNKNIIGKIKVVEEYYGEGFGKKPFSIQSLNVIQEVKKGNLSVLKKEKWLKFLALTSERNVNLERINSLEEMKNNYVLDYVEKTLKILSNFILDKDLKHIIEETLKWSEVSKGGLLHQRKEWIKSGFNLFAHNIGSAQVYERENIKGQDLDKKDTTKELIYNLIITHGLIGQYIRGEVPIKDNEALYGLIKEEKISREDLKLVLKILNYCVITSVDESIWMNIHSEVDEAIEIIISGQFEKDTSIKERIRRLRSVSAQNGEDFDFNYYKFLSNINIEGKIEELLKKSDLWYVEAALYDFSFEEFIKIFLIIYMEVKNNNVKHISFEKLMKDIYYQHDGKKRVNIYKKRIIEKYLSRVTITDILKGEYWENHHVVHKVTISEELDDTMFFTFRFSSGSTKLIDFCIEAEKSDILYEKAIILLFDLFDLRRDKYDRFYEEESYLQTMNSSIDYKKILLKYIKGDSIIDIGPGGGALMDLIEDTYPLKKVVGVDIAQNVIDNLKKKKQLENRKWEVLYGDALNLKEYVKEGSVDTVIFCSILHELFSYIQYQGKKFNIETLKKALKSAFDILPQGGRIIIRDGIMSQPENQKRIIKFLSQEGIEFLKRYVKDFKGRDIKYELTGQNEVLMTINDSMEFLYTYTWGEKSYVHEVNEQFGYFTPQGFKDFIYSTLGDKVKIVEFKHFLQEGYTIALSQKIEYYDEYKNTVRLPDSTCIVVIEKVSQ